MADEPPYRRQVLDHLGLVAGLCDALGLSDISEQATRQHPALRARTAGEAVQALGLQGLGLIHPALSLVPRCCQHQPPSRLMAPRVPPAQLHDDARGRALDPLYASGVTALYRLLAVTAAPRLGRCPRSAPRDRPSLPVDGRSPSAEEPAEPGVPSTQGSRRAPRPARNHGRLALRVEPQAGLAGLLQPLRGTSREVQELGPVVREPMAQWPTPDGATSLGAARALYSADTLPTLANPPRQGIPRVPAPRSAAQAPLAQAEPQAMGPLPAG